MGALRISILFFLTVVLATFVMLASSRDLRPASLKEYEGETSGFLSFNQVMSDAVPCGRRDNQPPLLTTSETRHSHTIVADYLEPRSSAFLEPRDLPGIVKLEPEYDLSPNEVAKGHCSATRIARNWFVTAAHCVASGYDRIVLKTGNENLTANNIRTVAVDYAMCHSGFRGETTQQYENDLSLLHISNDNLFALTDVPVVKWGVTSQPFSTVKFRSARVGGWGLKTYGGELNDHLQKMELDILHIDRRVIRLSSRAGRGPCVGDSGGPLIVSDEGRPVLMGVLSTISSNRYGEMCAGNYVSNYTNLTAYRSWAFNTMAVCEASDARCRVSEG